VAVATLLPSNRRPGRCANSPRSGHHRWRVIDVAKVHAATIGGPCETCGVAVVGRRRWCAASCEMEWRRYGGAARPKSTGCKVCGSIIDLTARRKDGRRQRADIKVCADCRRRMGRSRVNVPFVYHRDGPRCGICGDDVDVTIRRGADAVRCASVDHIVPLARGGTDDPSNLQLAHLGCNQRKAANTDARTVQALGRAKGSVR